MYRDDPDFPSVLIRVHLRFLPCPVRVFALSRFRVLKQPGSSSVSSGAGLDALRLVFADDADLGFEADVVDRLNALADVLDQGQDVASGRLAAVDDEAGVLFRDLRVTDAVALQAQLLDHGADVLAGRALEDGA